MIRKLLNFIKYTGCTSLFFKLPISWLLNRLGYSKTATKIMCKKPYILRTPFGNYLATTLFHYFCIIENYESEIGKEIENISTKLKGKQSYLINIGANIGRRSIGLAKKYGYKVIAFEPGPSTFHNLKINTVLSDLDDDIELLNIGLGNNNATMKFSMGVDCDAMGHIISDENTDVEGTINIPVRKFDDLLLDDEKINKTRLVIMDVEGYELNVLKGMKKSLQKFNDIHIIMEIWNNHKDKDETIQFMKNLGYKEKQIDIDNRLFFK